MLTEMNSFVDWIDIRDELNELDICNNVIINDTSPRYTCKLPIQIARKLIKIAGQYIISIIFLNYNLKDSRQWSSSIKDCVAELWYE